MPALVRMFAAAWLLLPAAALSLLLVADVAGQADAADELAKVQGRFERKFANDAGTVFRSVKEVIGDRSTVTTYDDVGNVVQQHTSQLKVEKRDGVRVLSFFNQTVTAGPAKGKQQLGTRSYLYRVDDKSFTEVWGLLEGDDSPPRMFSWRRLKDDEP